jgi:hypothetical protein
MSVLKEISNLIDSSFLNIMKDIQNCCDDDKCISIEMLENNTHRTEEQRNKFLSLIKQYVETDECEFEDKTSKFDFDNFRVVTLRGYSKKNEDENPKKGNWKFKSYQNHFDIKTPFINNTNSIKKNECEILTCLDTYILKDNNGKVLEKNLKTVWWIGYKY